mmetsp:Transcript_10501/g.34767  ORF Transcript_10501/g.34767 Transcript_10501/m.34767 type:complete len:201 (-) Transcript_10501:900-1502(-)
MNEIFTDASATASWFSRVWKLRKLFLPSSKRPWLVFVDRYPSAFCISSLLAKDLYPNARISRANSSHPSSGVEAISGPINIAASMITPRAFLRRTAVSAVSKSDRALLRFGFGFASPPFASPSFPSPTISWYPSSPAIPDTPRAPTPAGTSSSSSPSSLSNARNRNSPVNAFRIAGASPSAKWHTTKLKRVATSGVFFAS